MRRFLHRRLFSSERRSSAEQAKFESTLRSMFDEWITFNATLGLRVVSLRPPVARLPFRKELVGHYGHNRLHGGAISATLDSLGGFALMVALSEKFAQESTNQILQRFSRMGTIDLRVDFLRQAKGEYFLASAEVTRLGGRVGSTQMRLEDDQGTLVATGAAAYVVS